METRQELLEDALRRWQRDDHAGALEQLVAVWRDWRAPALGDLICRLTTRASQTRDPIRPTSSQSAAEAWRQVEALADPLDLPRLLEPIPKATTGLQAERMKALLARPPHPLVTRAIVGWWEARTVTVWFAEVVAWLEQVGDPGVAARLVAMAPGRMQATKYVGRRNAPLLVELALKAAAWSPPPATAGESQALEAFAALDAPSPASATDVPALFARVFAEPADDTLRALLADVLLSRGDPRGEFISLQLARGDAAPTKRERQLEAQWTDAWLGPLAKCFRKGVVFRRGFPAEGAYEKSGDPSWPAWSTFEALDLAPASGFVGGGLPILLNAPLRSLVRVTGIGRPTLDADETGRTLSSLPRVPWTTLGLQCVEGFRPVVAQLLTDDRFPLVTALELGAMPSWGRPSDALVADVVALPWLSRLSRLRVVCGLAGHEAALATKVPTVELSDLGEWCVVTLHRQSGVLDIALRGLAVKALELASFALERLGASVSSVRVSAPRCTANGTVLKSGARQLDLAPLVVRVQQLGLKAEWPWS